MENYTIDICKQYGLPGTATLECFIHSDTKELHPLVQNLPCMIVCPGGGYGFVSEREGEPVAIDFYNRMYNVFVLRYNVAPDYRYPHALTQLACAVDYARKNYEKFMIDPNKIFVGGFSAGGHLVGSLANFWHSLPNDLIDSNKLNAQPNGVMLCYPVIYPQSHIGSFNNLFGDGNENNPLVKQYTLDKTASDKNPPCFIWTTAEDNCVKPDATLRYATAMYENGVKFECHIFPTGWHGGSTCDKRTNENFDALKCADVWIDLADKFFTNL